MKNIISIVIALAATIASAQSFTQGHSGATTRPLGEGAAFISQNEAAYLRIQEAAEEAQYALERSSAGLLKVKQGANLFDLSPDARQLIVRSIPALNNEILAGRLILLPNLEVVPTVQGPLFGGSNWFSWKWWGYQAGLSSYRLDVLTYLLEQGATSSVFSMLTTTLGWGASAAWPATFYCLAYYVWINLVDTWGGHRGVMFTATWGNFWCPVVTRQ